MHAPVNPENGKYYGLSHISFCYDVEPSTATPTVTNTPVIAEVNAAAAGGNRDTMLNLAARLDQYNNYGCPQNGGGNGKAGASTLPGLPDSVESLFLPAIKR